ncbi:MAG: hypothetical protein KOO69_05290 [Victivallales bacterium]|nr:hypothetical protein [Victivallales bacterium]
MRIIKKCKNPDCHYYFAPKLRTNTIRIRSVAAISNAKDIVTNYASVIIIAVKSVILFGMRV